MWLATVCALTLGAGSASNDPALVLTGTASSYGLEAPFAVHLTTDGGFLLRVEGRLPWMRFVSGEHVLSSDFGSTPIRVSLRDREIALLDSLAWTGAWKFDDTLVRVSDAEESGGSVLDWRIVDGRLTGRVTLDTDGNVRTLRLPGQRSGRRWSYEWQSTEHGWLPAVAELTTDEGLVHRFVVEAVHERETYGEVSPALRGGSQFDASPRELEVRRASTGHLFVRPLVNGRDLGWFLFDSGAGATMLAAGAIEELGLERFGRARLTGFGPDVHATSFVELESLKLGPLEITDLIALERVGPSMASRILGEPVAGVLGWDVFLRCVVTVDPTAGTIAIEDPGAFAELPPCLGEPEPPVDADWQPLTLHWNVPYVTARFEGDREGLFCLDTGAGAKSVIFHADAVRRLGLLEGRDTTTFEGGGAGGAVTMHEGQLDWFEVAGRRHAPAPALFSTGDDGEADPYTLGFLGAGFLGDVAVVYDYGRRRVAFVPRGR